MTARQCCGTSARRRRRTMSSRRRTPDAAWSRPAADNGASNDARQSTLEVPIELTAAELDSLIASLEAANEARLPLASAMSSTMVNAVLRHLQLGLLKPLRPGTGGSCELSP